MAMAMLMLTTLMPARCALWWWRWRVGGWDSVITISELVVWVGVRFGSGCGVWVGAAQLM